MTTGFQGNIEGCIGKIGISRKDGVINCHDFCMGASIERMEPPSNDLTISHEHSSHKGIGVYQSGTLSGKIES
jgi:hypothetical protein